MSIARHLITLLLLPSFASAMHKTQLMNPLGPVTPTRLEQNRLNILQHTTSHTQAASSAQPTHHYTPLQTAWCQVVHIIKPEITNCLPAFTYLCDIGKKAASIPTSKETDTYLNSFLTCVHKAPAQGVPSDIATSEELCKLTMFCLERDPGLSLEITGDHLACLLHRLQNGNDKKIIETVAEVIDQHCTPSTSHHMHHRLMQWYARAKEKKLQSQQEEQLYFQALTQQVCIDNEIRYSNRTLGVALLLMRFHTDTASPSAIVKKMYGLYEKHK